MTRRLALTAVTAAAVLGLVTPAPASAAPAGGPNDPRAALIGGRSADGAMMGGYLIVTGFTLGPAGELLANGTLNAALTGPAGSVQRRASQPVTLPVDRGASNSTCYQLNLYLGPGDATVDGSPVRLDRSNFLIELLEGPGSRLLMPLCGIRDLLPAADTATLRDALNDVVRVLSIAADTDT
jgi:hypothetical protein